MCLTKFTDLKINSTIGYKVFEVYTASTYKFAIQYSDEILKEDRWYDAEGACLYTEEGLNKYQAGFHIFLNKKDAECMANRINTHFSGVYLVKEVEFKNVVAAGVEIRQYAGEEMEVIVAKEMRICV